MARRRTSDDRTPPTIGRKRAATGALDIRPGHGADAARTRAYTGTPSRDPRPSKGAAAKPAADGSKRKLQPAVGAGRKESGRHGGRPRRRRRNGDGRKRSLARRLIAGSVRLGFFAAVLGLIAFAGIVAYYAATLPPTSEWELPDRPPNVAIVSQRGDLIANRGDTGGRAVRLKDLPPYLPQAVIAIEDRRFYQHFGIDPIGLARAVVANLRAGHLVQGGSTLTQQLAKNLFVGSERTIERKIQEMILAGWLEIDHSKQEIIETYLNRVYLGAGAYGVDAAAHRYFGKPATEIDLQEAAMLAGLLKAPSYYSPMASLERAAERAATVLKAMQEAGYITADDRAYAVAHPARLTPSNVAKSGGYVADWVAAVLPDYIGSVQQDVFVETTIDLELQQAAQSSLRTMLAEHGAEKGVEQGAVVVMDGSGAIKALVGGRDYAASQFNRAIDAHRQPGSAFKPFVYLAALEDGLTPDTMRIDQPTTIGDWTPENYTRKYYGPVSLTTALAHSLNTVAAQLANEVGPSRVANVARRLGIRSQLDANASIALGTSEVTLLELTTAYVPFSNGGLGVIPHVIRRVRTADGDILYERTGGGGRQVVSPEAVGAMNRMLSEALVSGTAQRAQIDGWPAAGKTGTSQDWRDAWFIGYTAFFTAGIWLGNDDNSPTKKATGGTLPALMWRALMQQVHAGMQVAELPGARVSGRAPGPGDRVPMDQPWLAGGGRQLVDGGRLPAGGRDVRDWIRPQPGDRREPGWLRRQLFGR